ncbi:MAG: hypothetical protein JSV33_08645 [bacterium]|nr:MAG: hypothetical protein JSV33_08645 [bacterium]
MSNRLMRILGIVVILFVLGSTVATSQPQKVPRLTERPLDRAAYVELAKQWKAYIEKHGESVEALINLGMAYHYSREIEAAMSAGKRAVEIEPDNPYALAFYAKMLALDFDKADEAIKYLERSRKIAPDHGEALITLTAAYLKRGELEKSDAISRTIFDQKIYSRPIQDYAYNMLVGLPNGAVLITNGDTDTFPPLALQQGMDFRKDVIVINRHLLNIREYAEALFERYPAIRPSGDIIMKNEKKARTRSRTLLERMINESRVPVYFAVSVNFGDLGFGEEFYLEGLNKRSSGKMLSAEESARLFLETYRMDSATDWSYAWELVPSYVDIMTNYVTCMINLAQDKDVSAGTERGLLEKAMEIAEFHEMHRLEGLIRALKKK